MAEPSHDREGLNTENDHPPAEHQLGWEISYIHNSSDDAVATEWDRQRVIVNCGKVPSPALARFQGAVEAAKAAALSRLMRSTKTQELKRLLAEDPIAMADLNLIDGAGMIGQEDPERAAALVAALPPAADFKSAFRRSWLEMVLTGKIPEHPVEVREALQRMPTSPQTHEHLLTRMSNGDVAIDRRLIYYQRFLKPELDRFDEVDRDVRAGTSDQFVPSTEGGEEEELDESQIEQRLEPYYGGYFRENVMDAVDWKSMAVVATGAPEEKLVESPALSEAARSGKRKTYNFFGINGLQAAKRPLTIPLPAGARPLPSTLDFPGAELRVSSKGCVRLEWKQPPDDPAVLPQKIYEFDLVFVSEDAGWMKAEPTESEQGIPEAIIQTFSTETRDFLIELSSSPFTTKAKAARIARRVQTTIEYVNDDAVGQQLQAAGQNYFRVLEALKKGDCDVSNFYALAQLRAIGTACRMVTGFFVKKNKKYPYAVLAGTKHAWLEFFDAETKRWTRLDATPPAKPDEDEEKDKEGSGGEEIGIAEEEGEEGRVEPDEGETKDPTPWSDDVLEKIKAFLEQQSDASTPDQQRDRQAAERFQLEHGISLEAWNRVLAYLRKIDATPIASDQSVEKKGNTTIGNEWKKIFDALLIAYRITGPRRRIVTRQSQGSELVDPVSAAIDVMTGSEDPFGFQRVERRSKIERLPVGFSNDFLLDLTASMEAVDDFGHSLKESQRQFLLGALYHAFVTNERLRQFQSELAQVPYIRSHLFSIHGGDKYQELTDPSGKITLEQLASLYDKLNTTTTGAGAMADAVETYVQRLESDSQLVERLKRGEVLKTLTILSDGNLWCSSCGQESCSYQLHGPAMRRTQAALQKIRLLGVKVHAIGFTEQSRPVADLFSDPGDPQAAIVVENIAEGIVRHHAQVVRAMQPILEAARRRLAQ